MITFIFGTIFVITVLDLFRVIDTPAGLDLVLFLVLVGTFAFLFVSRRMKDES